MATTNPIGRTTASKNALESNVPVSLLDTDLYKVRIFQSTTSQSGELIWPAPLQLTMQNAVFKTFPDAHSEYKFTNRAPDMLFSRKCYDWVKEQVQGESFSCKPVLC